MADVGYIHSAVYTSPHATPDLDPEPALLSAINSAKHSIEFAIYSFTLPAVAAAMVSAVKRGVTVRGIVDHDSLTGGGQGYVIANGGADVKVWGGSYRLMHDKVLIVDGCTVALGSYNWSTQAETENIEVLLLATGAVVERHLAPALQAAIEAGYAAAVPLPSPAVGGLDASAP